MATSVCSIEPKVSILMPTLNSARFLNERLDSIFSQTLTNWELIVADSYSDDGTWLILNRYAALDPRIRLYQIPKTGIYPALNFCIEKACGNYIYIATSDDTMIPECLETMVDALEKNPECDLCHTCLKVIDENSKEIPGWWEKRPATRFFGRLDKIPHIRFAPYDGVLYMLLHVVYGSLTQLLLKKSVFEKAGLFRSDWGARGDFEWGMRVGSVCNTLHLPNTLATWRIHPNQATDAVDGSQLCEMLNEGLMWLKTAYPATYNRLDLFRIKSFYKRIFLAQKLKKNKGLSKKIYTLLFFLFVNPYTVISAVISSISGKNYLNFDDNIIFLKKEIIKCGLDKNVKII